MNLALADIAEMDTISAITSCVGHGLGVSIVPHVAVQDEAQPLVAVPFGRRPSTAGSACSSAPTARAPP